MWSRVSPKPKAKKDDEVADKKEKRQRVMTLLQVQQLFDNSRNREQVYLEALATVMNTTLDAETRASDVRIHEAAEKELAAATKAAAAA